ncbi:MAG: glutathione-disulfide reductase [Bdellovibrionales bacterium]
MAAHYDYDLFVIGGGSGGIRAARWSAQLGAKVALCESDRMGGTCVIRGCIPKKLMVYGSSFQKSFETARSYGWEFDSPQLNWETFNTKRDQEIQRLEGIYSQVLKNAKVDFIPGEGKIQDPHRVQVEGKNYTARHILIAVGSWPLKIPIPGAEHACTSNEIFSLKKQPASLLVIGAGYIGLEFASIFQELGTQVSVMFRKDYILAGFDQDIRKHLQEQMTQRKIKMLAGRTPVEIQKKGETYEVKDHKGAVWSGDLVLMATGRKAKTQSLNLEAVGVELNKSNFSISVDSKFQTSCPSIFAVGDCIDKSFQLTPVALYEGMFVSEYLFAKNTNQHRNYAGVPSAVFTQPEVGTVGLSEEEALKQGFKVRVFESRFRPLKLTLTDQMEKSYMKLIVCQKTDQVLGCHLVGDSSAEILQGFAVAIKNKMTKQAFDQTIGIHPSSAEELVTMRTERKL